MKNKNCPEKKSIQAIFDEQHVKVLAIILLGSKFVITSRINS